MEAIDELIFELYRMAGEDEWREYRPRALTRLVDALGGAGGAWWTRVDGVGSGRGELTRTREVSIDPAALATLSFPATGTAVIEIPGAKGRTYAVCYPHRDGSLISTVVVQFAAAAVAPPAEQLLSPVGHLIEAGTLSLQQFIRRDDWLHALGRTSRGSAALVDADGAVHAASTRFASLIGGGEGRPVPAVLPFELPEDVLGDEGGEFVRGPLHVRVARVAPLYLIYARQPLPLDSLSPREQEIARALGDGKTLKSIARQYGIAVSTVANHTTRIYRKLAIYRREDLIELVRTRAEPGRKAG